jgi:polysaccharide deacetylase 2 family uncharacterized protein YibQ
MTKRPNPKRSLSLLLLFLMTAAPAAQTAEPPPRLVIIIDDLGYRLEAGRRATALPGKLNLSILPETPNGPALARLGLAAGKEILLHAPMSNLNEKPLGGGGLTETMTEEQLRRVLAASLDSTPGVRGVNNHMGSLLTTRRQPMEWVMDELASRGLYYVDSRTTSLSLAATVAEEYGVPNLSRNVFLDNEVNSAAIHDKFQQLLAVAERRGVALAIGHPHDPTLDYLEKELPRLTDRGYRLSFISEVVGAQLAQGAGEAAGSD